MSFKTCNYCNESLPETSFGRKKRNNGSFGIRGVCKSCHTTKNSISRKKCGRKTTPKTYASARKRSLDYYYENRGNPEFKAKACNLQARRRSYKLKATPDWLTQDQLEDIKNFYWLAQDLKLVTGETYHVDHIVPLKGKSVCGLHVPWNLQVLPADINLSKGNHYANDA